MNAKSKLRVAKILFQLLLPVNSIGFQTKFVCKNESSDTHILFDFLQIFFWKYFSGMQTFIQVCAQSIEKISVWGGNNMPKTPDQKLALLYLPPISSSMPKLRPVSRRLPYRRVRPKLEFYQ